ncbi:M48 family metallopeptidase [Phocoenobacter skyensis]|uniref:M48 family metallopeptidase n=1 Tax=Phocoenobacter skyensis TaxID=97481 RepID=A0A1H7XXY9_9PAST|nr:M48 family metallopeptidase [Pasteurella skyensis]MDP8079802.1 M48 family metallopeptidase [Pasteurella skyensis]MDP8085729.1 M48 family metallopeptidase [Pasteurella skyensis]MDP8185557.1 M48 family metallopeptidase [Pasteurella skyensis]QLB21818.1 deoxyribonuclease HsdR [Pasteurella skyensis]SEM38792.1 Zn-dependent protease with chaperone function [Pasteurella skyensis]
MKLKQYLGIVVVSAVALSGCTSTSQINNEAANSYTKVVSHAKSKGVIDTRSRTSKRIHTIFKRMVPYANKANQTGVPFNWQITVVKSKELNAWAMPGGKMMVYTGLVDKLKLSDAEIATVMGHEMAHALKEHSKSSRTVGMVTGIAATIGKVALATQGISTDVGGIDMVAVTKDLALDKPFSRSHETEADEVGLMLMAQSGYNPSAAPNVWTKMSKVTGDSSTSIFSTHPTNSDRQANLQRLLPEAMKVYQQARK